MVHKIGYIGFGSSASGYHYNATLRDDNNFEAVAVYDIKESQRELARSLGLTTFDDLQEFLDSKLFDFVVVATPNNHHFDMCCAALEAGYDVLCEKPIAPTFAEAKIMYETAKRLGKLLLVQQNKRYDKDFLMVRNAIYENLIGNPYQFETRIQTAGNGCPTGWKGFEDHGGGMLLDEGVDLIDQMIYLIDEPVKDVYAKLHNVNNKEVDAYINLVLTFKSGLKVIADANSFACYGLPRFAFYGGDGAILIDGDVAKVRRLKNKEYYETAWEAYPDGEHTIYRRMKDIRSAGFEEINLNERYPEIVQDYGAYYQHLEQVLDRVEYPIVTREQVLEVLKIIDAARESNRTGEVVHI